MIRVCTAILLLASSAMGQQTYTISGHVSDSRTGESLASANVRVSGTSRGTITNLDGSYLISLPPGNYTIVYSYIGYQTDSVRVELAGNLKKDIKLVQGDIILPEVVSIAEDPANAIIRRAIAMKHKWQKLLRSYEFKAFTRLTIYRDTSLAGITESYTNGYWQKGDSIHEVVVQRRETKNLPEASLIPSVGEIVNFTDDVIEYSGYKFVGPIAENAFDYYKYRLLRTFRKSNLKVYEIEVTPLSRVVPLFSGKISIADSSYAVMGATLKPNEAFTIPFVSDLDLTFSQRYSLYQHKFWMPTDIITDFGMTIEFAGLTLPRLAVKQTSDIYEYKLNPFIPDSVFEKSALVVDSSSTKFDSTFWKEHQVLPLTVAEQTAYHTLDSNQTLQKQFKPRGATADLLAQGGPLSALRYIDIRFDRVEGLFLGGRYTYTSGKRRISFTMSNEGASLSQSTSGWQLNVAAGYGFSDRIFKWQVGGAYPFGGDADAKGFSIHQALGADVFRDIRHYPEDNYFSSFTATITSLFGRNDCYDYYMASGWSAHYSIIPAEALSATVTYSSEDETSVVNHTDFSILSLGNTYRSNQPIVAGEMCSIKLAIRYGDEPAPLQILPVNAVEFSGEYSSPSLGSDFHFGRYEIKGSYHFNTFLSSYLFPPQTQLMVSGGISTGNLPVQREFVLDSQTGGLAPFGVLKTAQALQFVGDRFVMASVEQNFRNVPFLLTGIPFLYKRGLELLVDVSAAQSWLNGKSTTNGWYYEAGVGVGKILGLFRIDWTYRLSSPHASFLSLGVSSIF